MRHFALLLAPFALMAQDDGGIKVYGQPGPRPAPPVVVQTQRAAPVEQSDFIRATPSDVPVAPTPTEFGGTLSYLDETTGKEYAEPLRVRWWMPLLYGAVEGAVEGLTEPRYRYRWHHRSVVKHPRSRAK